MQSKNVESSRVAFKLLVVLLLVVVVAQRLVVVQHLLLPANIEAQEVGHLDGALPEGPRGQLHWVQRAANQVFGDTMNLAVLNTGFQYSLGLFPAR